MMAREMTKSGEILLPNDLFSDDFFIDRNGNGGSNPSSPVESVAGTKSENGNSYISAITQQMASSFLHEDYKNMPSQSTLCGIRSPSKVSSHDQDFLRCESNHALIQQQLQAARFYELKRQQLIRVKQIGSINCCGDEKQGSSHRLPNWAWPHIQKQQRAVFPNGARRESKGTGVFLPRRIRTQNEPPRKKQDCSTTVLIPARVVQALSLNLDDVHRRVPGTYLIDQETLIGRGNATAAPGKRNPLCTQRAVGSAHDLRLLPPEWTY